MRHRNPSLKILSHATRNLEEVFFRREEDSQNQEISFPVSLWTCQAVRMGLEPL